VEPEVIFAGASLTEFQVPDFGEVLGASVKREPGLPLASE
jgi:hypothetical protein